MPAVADGDRKDAAKLKGDLHWTQTPNQSRCRWVDVECTKHLCLWYIRVHVAHQFSDKCARL